MVSQHHTSMKKHPDLHDSLLTLSPCLHTRLLGSVTGPHPHQSFPYLFVRETVGQEWDGQDSTCLLRTRITDLVPNFHTFSTEYHLNDLTFGNVSISSINIIPDLKLLHKWKAHFKHKTDGKFLKVWSARIPCSLMAYKLHLLKDHPGGWWK